MGKEDLLRKLFSGNKQLPSLPQIFVEFNKLIKDPYISNKKISEVIMKDQSMVVKILKLSNSAIYGKRHEINNLNSAITYIGLETLRNIILQISLVRMFQTKHNIPEFDISTFWKHSLGTAYFTTLLEKKLKLAHDEDYYIAGLIHDIGKLAIYQFYPEEFEKIILLQVKENIVDYEAEERVFGLTHCEIGDFLADKWNFSVKIKDPIRYHHKKFHKKVKLIVALTRIANMFSKTAGLCFDWDYKIMNIIDDEAWYILKENMKSDIDIELLTFEIMDEKQAIIDLVNELLS